MVHWHSLPAEIRSMILETLTAHKGVAPYATVSTEWRTFIEKRIFSHLRLHQMCLDQLEQLSDQQQGRIEHLWLNIELKSYSCRVCEMHESVSWCQQNERIVKTAIVKLFSILAKWKGSLTLELNAYSPSDSKHWFPNCYFGAPDEKKFECQPIHRAEPSHHIVVAPPDNALRRPFEIGGPTFRGELVPVQVVTKFILRRQCRRQFGAEMLLRILPKLPRLEEITYEPWVLHFGPIQDIWDRGYNEMINRLPPNVKRLTIFEDFNESYLELLDLGRSDFRDHKPKRVRASCPILGLSFASRSREREHLSVAFMIDARHFFDACRPCWTWPKLQTLTLTSREMIKPDGRETNKLLQDVARVVLNMPQLQTLTIWYGERKEACAFIYRREDRTVNWQGNRDLELEANTLEAWEKVTVKHSGLVLLVEKRLFVAGITSHGDAVHHLGLPDVVDKVSLQQIRAENGVSWV